MGHLLTRHFLWGLLPALLAPLLFLAYLPALEATAAELSVWRWPLTALGLAGMALAALFGQWRHVLALAAVIGLPMLGDTDLLARSAGHQALAVLITALVLAGAAVLPERGPTGPILWLAAGLAVLMLGLMLRDIALPMLVARPLAEFELAGRSLALTRSAVAVLLCALAVTVLQGWRPDPLRAGLLAASLCLLPLTGALGTEPPLRLAIAPMLLLLWAGLLLHAWHLAFRDELTGLPNRRALELRLRAGPRPVGMVDVDHFKRFNDRHGHDAGDQVLRRVAETLAGTRGARAYRYGGEEFTLVFRRRPLARLKDFLEEQRRALAERPFRLRTSQRRRKQRGKGGGRGIKITASFGLAMPRRGETPAAVIKRADQALYRAKAAGRNRVEIDE
ncbi:GGDEF domain-containing protein [Gammaproteobacteria bacterium AB-CW1]|uniref:diguanylate cyclase n=1 Tax=Natronospira elongata TaxID=3110268 RepID=A0AAP6MKC8_9GAMM|nr:GGDEF domain-containing protein [Gammaproteobacteria bacterium AB-CW1]